MSSTEEMLQKSKVDRIIIYDSEGKVIFRIPVWLAVILVIGAPPLLVLTLVLMLAETIDVRYEHCSCVTGVE